MLVAKRGLECPTWVLDSQGCQKCRSPRVAWSSLYPGYPEMSLSKINLKVGEEPSHLQYAKPSNLPKSCAQAP